MGKSAWLPEYLLPIFHARPMLSYFNEVRCPVRTYIHAVNISLVGYLDSRAKASSEATPCFTCRIGISSAAWTWQICCHPAIIIPHFWYLEHLEFFYDNDHCFGNNVYHQVVFLAFQVPPASSQGSCDPPCETRQHPEHINNSTKCRNWNIRERHLKKLRLFTEDPVTIIYCSFWPKDELTII